MTDSKWVRAILFAAGATLVSAAATAQEAGEFSWGGSVGVTYTDNAGRVSTDEESDTTADVGLQFQWSRPEGRLQGDVGANLQYSKYFDDSFDDDLTGYLNGSLTYQFIPERFSWFVQESFGQTLIDARAVDTPGNRQGTNVFSTGPNVSFPLGSRTDLVIEGRWTDAAYEDSDTDSERLSALVSLVRSLSPTSYFSLNGSATRVEYDDVPPNSNYDINSVYIGYGVQGARTTLDLTAGQTAQHDFGDSTDGPLFSLGVSRKLSPRSTLRFNAGTNLVDTLDSFTQGYEFGVDGRDTSDAVVSRDVYQEDYLSLGLDLQGDRNSYGLAVDWSQEDHERDPTLDRERFGANARLSRRMRPSLSATLYGSWEREEFSSPVTEFDEWSVGIGFDWYFAQSLSLGLRLDHYEGSGDTSVGDGVRDYEENRVSLTLSYRPRR